MPPVDVPVPKAGLLKPPVVPVPPNALLVDVLLLAPNPPNVDPPMGAGVPPKSALLLVPPKAGFEAPNAVEPVPNPVPVQDSEVSDGPVLSTGDSGRSFAGDILWLNLVEHITSLHYKHKTAVDFEP